MLLLLRRKRLPASADFATIAKLSRELYGSILSIRQAARASALEFARDVYGAGLQPSGVGGLSADAIKSRQITSSLLDQFCETKLDNGPLVKRAETALVRVAITENANAYNAEHRFAVSEKAHRLGLVEVWDATLDKRTCEVCAELDGALAIDGTFPGSEVPGAVHPYCRCTSHFVQRNSLH